MTIPATTKAAMLDGLTFTHASLHTAFPGSTGANEVTGGSYARLAVTINPTSGSQRVLNAAVTFAVPACTIKWVGFWNGSIFLDSAPNGGSTPKNFVSLASDDKVYAPAHGFGDTQKIVFFSGTPPGGLTEGTTYYVRDATTDTFKVAASSGGTAIDLTSAASAGSWMCAITEDVYATSGTHQLSSSTIIIPD